MRTNPRPTPESIGLYYPPNYGPHVASGSQGPAGAASSSRWKQHVAAAIELRTEYLPPLSPGRMLEVGCGAGAFLTKMSTAGWDVEGLESSEHAAALARSLGHRVTTGPVEGTAIEESDFDLAVGWMVLEHLHHPVQALRSLYRAVRPGGWLVLSVPDASSLEFRVFGTYWYALELPRHLYHFTPRTVVRVANAAGWTMEQVVHQRVLSNILGSLGYELRERALLPGLSRRLVEFPDRPGNWNAMLFPLASLLAAIGQTGRMTIWARKLNA